MCCHSSTVLHSFIRSHVRVCLIARLTNLLTWFHLHQNLTNGLGTALRSWVELLRVRIRVSVLPSETASPAWWKSMMPQGASRSQFMPTLPTLLTSRSCNAHNPLLLNVRAPSLYRHIGWVFPPWEQPAARGPTVLSAAATCQSEGGEASIKACTLWLVRDVYMKHVVLWLVTDVLDTVMQILHCAVIAKTCKDSSRQKGSDRGKNMIKKYTECIMNQDTHQRDIGSMYTPCMCQRHRDILGSLFQTTIKIAT